ncbi:hypothetical protein MKZ38_010620 [Zalerion maritima]|uniref:Uncharacterized protein n=1 Tax=Zalerion maritima TaxID=339359 RepID=A0AAD5RTW5_9PEZI|nr:hypothetical protein MKZ38_010620 [Zalerion maritima]
MTEAGLDTVLRAYGVPFDDTALKSALQHPEHGPGLIAWAKDRLGSDNLLTRDELAMYAAIFGYTDLEDSGEVEQLASQDLAAVLGMDDRDIDDAIEQLSRSTASISKQTETLEQQHDALSRLVQTQAKNEGLRSAVEATQLHKWSTECKRLTSTVAELAQNIEFRVANLEQQAKPTGISRLDMSVDGLLESDDKLLSSLQKLGWELETEDPEEDESVEKLREICARLIKFTVETIRTKLDRIFLESLHAARRSSRQESPPQQDVTALQEEVESLFSEILPVAQMSVEQQYLEPALKSLSEKNGQSVTRTSEAIIYIDQCLDYVLDHLSRLSERISKYQAHQDATATILTAAKAELATHVESPAAAAKTEQQSATFASPVRRRRSSGGVSPVRQRITRRRSSGRFDDVGGPPLDTILDHLALSLVPDEPMMPVTPGPNAQHVPAPNVNPTRACQVTTDHVRRAAVALGERGEKAADVGRSVHEAIESGSSAHVADVKRAVQMLRDELLAETPYSGVNLIDPEIEGSIAVLRRELEAVKARTEGVESSISRAGKSGKRDEFVAKWSM